ncbi:MAG TPA: glutamate--tRNA ligase family protein [Gemmataceae bacterium]|nr:glutamate--tRNA ligase family protein [Gemmataceae bacterium]
MNTRFAPSPTGPLHLGHVAAMIYVWGLAGRCHARVDVRIEDHDRQRCRPQFIDDLQEDLEWLGFVPRNGGQWSRQTEHDERFQQALARLREQDAVYACRCSRKDAISDPGSLERRYPGTCRKLRLPEAPGTALRIRLPEDEVRFYDARHGWQTQPPADQCGDFVIRDRHGQWTYQFAVVVDDLVEEVNWIIRGDDLLASTGRQLILARLLGRRSPLCFYHHPLILSAAGTKLSKRDLAAPVQLLRDRGMNPAEVIGQAAFRCGLIAEPRTVPAEAVDRLFSELTADELWGYAYEFADRPM